MRVKLDRGSYYVRDKVWGIGCRSDPFLVCKHAMRMQGAIELVCLRYDQSIDLTTERCDSLRQPSVMLFALGSETDLNYRCVDWRGEVIHAGFSYKHYPSTDLTIKAVAVAPIMT